MKVLRGIVWLLCSLGVLWGAGVSARAATKLNKVMIYPEAGDSIDQLKQRGIEQVVDYGAYWLAQASDEQLGWLKQTYKDRLHACNYLNVIELATGTVDPTEAEPSVPEVFRETQPGAKRLRLVQFVGFVQPQWLERMKAAGNVQVIAYIPNCTYLVYVDAQAEANLKKMAVPKGPIQWVGAYQPWFKVQPSLLGPRATPEFDVHVTFVNDDQAAGTVAALQRYNFGTPIDDADAKGQRTVRLRVRFDNLAAIASLPNVIWIDRVVSMKPQDENQGMIVINQTNSLGGVFAPVNQYLYFLTATVGFSTNYNEYPIVDVVDGFLGYNAVQILPDFKHLGNPLALSRLTTITLYADHGMNYTATPDEHPNAVASLLTGYDPCLPFPPAYPGGVYDPRQLRQLVPICAGGGGCFENWVCVLAPEGYWVSNWFEFCNFPAAAACGNVGCPPPPSPPAVMTNLLFRYEFTLCTNMINAAGYQIRMGISPFGRFSNNAIIYNNDYGNGVFYWEVPNTTPANLVDKLILVNRNGYMQNRARISNNSWAASAADGAYDIFAQMYDGFTRDALLTGIYTQGLRTPPPSPLNQEVTYVFAAGYERAGTPGSAFEHTGGFGDVIVATPATAKNVISVGASENLRYIPEVCWGFTSDTDNAADIAWFSAAGPTQDGRFKPEIVAPGSMVVTPDRNSTLALPGVTPGCDPKLTVSVRHGTSYAVPAVSGAAQLLWWYFQNNLNVVNELGMHQLQPSPAMTKAYICNSAYYMPITDPISHALDTLPSIAQGMGRLDLERMFDGVPRVIRDETTPRAIDTPLLATNPIPQQTYFNVVGQSYEVSGKIADATKPFRVTLAWTDPPGSPVAFKQLVNDLDLEVTVNGKLYRGNAFVGPNSVDTGNPEPRSNVPDSLNNLESVFLPAGQTGTWSAVVRCISLGGPVPNVSTLLGQDFALVVYNGNKASDVPNMQTNNSCQTAMDLTSFPFSWTNTLSSTVYHKVHPNPHIGRGGPQEFFKIRTPSLGGTISANTVGSDFDTLLSVWVGTCGGLEEVAASDNTVVGLQSQVSWTVQVTNATYYIIAEGRHGAEGTLVLNVTATLPSIGLIPANFVDFGSWPIGGTSAPPNTVTLTNGSPNNLIVSGVSIVGPDAGNFRLGAETCTEQYLQSGDPCTMQLQFTPQPPVGLKTNAFLKVTDNATGSPRLLQLRGNALSARPAVCVSPGSLLFPVTPVGATSTNISLTITNCGTTNLTISGVAITGNASNDFQIVSPSCTGVIAPYGGCQVDIVFTPTKPGRRLAMLNILSDGTNGMVGVSLVGNAIIAAPVICATPANLAFGAVAVNSTSPVQSVVITNCGTADLVFTNVVITGTNSDQFATLSNSCWSGTSLITIPTNGACEIGVRFLPISMSNKTANLNLWYNTASVPTIIPLTGLGSGFQPDLRIGASFYPRLFIGAGIITDGSDPNLLKRQSYNLKVARGKKVVRYISVQNKGTVSDTVQILGVTTISSNATPAHFKVKYFLGAKTPPNLSTDLTSAIEGVGASSYSTASLAPDAITGDATWIRVEISVDKTAPHKSSCEVLVKGLSDGNSAKSDVVKITVTVP